ncbi:hypothetical protein ACHAW6_003787 [Cyclotella cf. meneghiniana]
MPEMASTSSPGWPYSGKSATDGPQDPDLSSISTAMRDKWLSPKIQKWATGNERLAAVGTSPHFAYAGIISCLSTTWQYICRAVPEIKQSLAPVENALRIKFLLAILGVDGPIDDELRTLLGNGVKTGGLAIWDPTLIATSLYSHLLRQPTCLPVSSSAMSPKM